MIKIIDPRCFPDHDGYSAPRLRDVKGRRIGLLWNNRPKGDVVLNLLGKELSSRHDVKVAFRSKLRVGTGAPDELIAELVSSTDAVIVGVGD